MTPYNKETFCPFYDQGLLIDATPVGNIRIAMCCFQARTEVDQVDFNHSALIQLRKESSVAIPAVCDRHCKIDNSINNGRQLAINEKWWDNSGQYLKKLHLKQGLICNLKCISCSSTYSSSWNTDYQIFEPGAPTVRLVRDADSSWSHLDLSHLTELHFDGGEPLLNTDSINILRHLDNLNLLHNITLNYNTNGTVFPSIELIDLWSKCKWVRLFFSLDGVGSTFEYTRYPAMWNEVCANLHRFQQIKGPCLLLEVNAIVGIHNIFNLKDFYNWWKTNFQVGNQGDPTQIFVKPIEGGTYGGRVLRLQHLPRHLTALATDMLHSIIDMRGASELIPLLSTEDSCEWLDYFKKLDEIRGTDWQQSLPVQLTQYN
jgi:hypothetical protein